MTVGVNWQGMVVELFHMQNFTQTFYETICLPEVKDRPCQFVDPLYRLQSSCVQQFQYVLAMTRPFRQWMEPFRVEFLRIAMGCQCRLKFVDDKKILETSINVDHLKITPRR